MHNAPLSTAFVLGAASVVAVSACASERVVAPDRIEATTIGFDAQIAAEFADGLDIALEDARERLAPSLGADLEPKLRGQLQQLALALRAGDANRARRALERADELLAPIGESPDADAIRLALDHAAAALQDDGRRSQ